MTTHIKSADELFALIGKDLGTTDWLEMTQDRVYRFADATGDHQWIHVDPSRAKEGPFGACIAHGYLSLSLAGSYFLEQIVKVDCKMAVNYGSDRLRFPAPVLVGAKVRGVGRLMAAEAIGAAVQATIRVTLEIQGGDKPGCVVDTISRYHFA